MDTHLVYNDSPFGTLPIAIATTVVATRARKATRILSFEVGRCNCDKECMSSTW